VWRDFLLAGKFPEVCAETQPGFGDLHPRLQGSLYVNPARQGSVNIEFSASGTRILVTIPVPPAQETISRLEEPQAAD